MMFIIYNKTSKILKVIYFKAVRVRIWPIFPITYKRKIIVVY